METKGEENNKEAELKIDRLSEGILANIFSFCGVRTICRAVRVIKKRKKKKIKLLS